MQKDQFFIIMAMIFLVAMIPVWFNTHSLLSMIACGGLSTIFYCLALNERGEFEWIVND